MNPAYLLGAVGSILYGAADFCGGVAARRGAATAVTFLSGFAALLVLLAGVPLTPGVIRPADLAWAAAAGACGGIGAMLIFRALALGPMSVASPVLCLVGLALPVIVGLALGERPTWLAVVGLLLMPVSIVLLAQTGFGLTPDEQARVRRVLVPAIGAGLAAGCFLVCFGRIQPGAGLWPLVLGRSVGIAVLGVALLGRRVPLLPPPPAWGLALGAGALDSLANVFYVTGVQRGSMALVAALVSLAPATSVVLARVFLHERWSVPQRVGFVVAVAAGALISMG